MYPAGKYDIIATVCKSTCYVRENNLKKNARKTEMKKIFSILLALTMLLCTACGGTDANEESANIYTDITGIAHDEIVMTVGEIEIPANLFFYWVNTIARDAEMIYRQYSMYYPQYATLLNSDGSLKWDATYSQTMTLGDVVRLQAMEKLAYFVVTESMAKTNGIELTEADRTEINETIEKNLTAYKENLVKEDAANAELTDEEIEQKYFYNLGVDRTQVERMMAVTYLSNALVEQLMTEGSSLYVEDKAYDDFAFYADHILIATVDLDSGKALPAEEIQEKTELAESILARLQESDDMETLFASLADFHSEDTGRTAYPTGYIFTEGTMVAEFENAVKELEVGELSGLVKSTYGYHIILRRDLAEGLKAYPEEKKALAETYLATLINTIIANSNVSTGDALTDIDLSQVYSTYMERIGQRETSQSGAEVSDK